MYFAEEMRSKGNFYIQTVDQKDWKEDVVDRPKALGDIRGVTYIYGMFYRFGLIDVPDEVKEKMGHPKNRKKQVAMYRSVR